jgi:hypothetical protein
MIKGMSANKTVIFDEPLKSHHLDGTVKSTKCKASNLEE